MIQGNEINLKPGTNYIREKNLRHEYKFPDIKFFRVVSQKQHGKRNTQNYGCHSSFFELHLLFVNNLFFESIRHSSTNKYGKRDNYFLFSIFFYHKKFRFLFFG